MGSGDQHTCGTGLAASAVLPEHLAQVANSLANLLHAHLATLDLDDAHARQEHAAYESLVDKLRQASDTLAATAREMTGYRNLPDGRHDLEAMAGQAEPFEQFVQQKRNLLALLQAMDEEDQAMLDEMGGE